MLAQAEHPRGKLPCARVLRGEHHPRTGNAQRPRPPLLSALAHRLHLAVAAEVPLHEPGDPLGYPDAGARLRRAELPVGAVGVRPRVEVVGRREVVLRLARVGDLVADAREPEDADVVALVRVADEVELAPLVEQVVGIHLALRLVVALDRVVAELDRLAPRDRGLDLGQALGELPPARGGRHGHGDRALLGRPERARASPGELLEREPQRLGVCEAPVEQRERSLKRRQLAVRELDRRQVEVLRRQRVELGLEVALRRLLDLQGDAQPLELGAVRVEAPREGIVVHLAVALDVLLDLERRHGPALGHQERDQRKLADQLLSVFGHPRKDS